LGGQIRNADRPVRDFLDDQLRETGAGVTASKTKRGFLFDPVFFLLFLEVATSLALTFFA
jgi:hypothetical protein